MHRCAGELCCCFGTESITMAVDNIRHLATRTIAKRAGSTVYLPCPAQLFAS